MELGTLTRSDNGQHTTIYHPAPPPHSSWWHPRAAALVCKTALHRLQMHRALIRQLACHCFDHRRRAAAAPLIPQLARELLRCGINHRWCAAAAPAATLGVRRRRGAHNIEPKHLFEAVAGDAHIAQLPVAFALNRLHRAGDGGRAHLHINAFRLAKHRRPARSGHKGAVEVVEPLWVALEVAVMDLQAAGVLLDTRRPLSLNAEAVQAHVGVDAER